MRTVGTIKLRRVGAAALCVFAALALLQPASAVGQRPTPSADELWETYPLHPTVSPTPTPTSRPAAERARSAPSPVPAAPPDDGGGGGALLIVAGVLAAAVVAVGVGLRARRPGPALPAEAPSRPAGSPTRSPLWTPAGEAAPRRAVEPRAQARRPPPAKATPRVEPQTPWPQETEARWRCEITLDAGPLSSRVQAVAFPPGSDRGVPIAAASASASPAEAARDWQSPEGLERAVQELAATLRAEGWEPAGQGAGWYARRFSWLREDPPPFQAKPETAGSGGAEATSSTESLAMDGANGDVPFIPTAGRAPERRNGDQHGRNTAGRSR